MNDTKQDVQIVYLHAPGSCYEVQRHHEQYVQPDRSRIRICDIFIYALSPYELDIVDSEIVSFHICQSISISQPGANHTPDEGNDNGSVPCLGDYAAEHLRVWLVFHLAETIERHNMLPLVTLPYLPP